MQISDLVKQYHQAISSGAETLTGTKGVENLVASLRSLTKGNIFEGTVTSVKNGRVTLSLSGGQQVMARLDGKISLMEGESMFFQVKSNDGTQIAIRPFAIDGAGANYTLMQALSAAGLSAQPEYLSMVDRMMEEQMPIDRESLQQMARLVNANPRIDVQTLVQMQKLGIPITVENASQFENYMNDSQAITRELDALIEQFPQSLTGTEGAPVKTETMRQLGNELLQILTDGLEEVPQQIQSPEPDMAYNLDGLKYESVQTDTAETQMQTEAAPETATETVQENPEILSQQEGQAAAEEKGVAGQQEAETMETVSGKTTYTGQMSQTPHTLGAVLSQEQLQHLNRMIGDILGKPQSAYNANSGTVEVLKDLQQLCKDPLPLEREHLGKLFSSREFQKLVRDTAEQQWMVKPGNLKEGDYVGRLYERLNSQMEKIESALKNAGQEHTAFSQMAGEIHSNVEFMNQVNQMYTYAQIPLKMSGQHASGELFVYTNKKALAQGEKDLTAFLHLDLDHLGSTDVSVRMRGREVSTRFYLDNDTAYALLEKNYPVLEARLEKKGYHCKIDVVNEEKHVNFVDDFLKMDQPAATQLHRYSFDMRA